MSTEYIIRLVRDDKTSDNPRVELHDTCDGLDVGFLEVDPSIPDIARAHSLMPKMASAVAMAESAIKLADSTRTFYTILALEGERWLKNEAILHPYPKMNDDEREAAIALGIIRDPNI